MGRECGGSGNIRQCTRPPFSDRLILMAAGIPKSRLETRYSAFNPLSPGVTFHHQHALQPTPWSACRNPFTLYMSSCLVKTQAASANIGQCSLNLGRIHVLSRENVLLCSPRVLSHRENLISYRPYVLSHRKDVVSREVDPLQVLHVRRPPGLPHACRPSVRPVG